MDRLPTSRNGRLAVGCGGLLGLCFVVMLCNTMFGGGSSTPPTTNTEVPATLAAVATVAPPDTEAPATDVPATQAPTADAAAAELCEYARWLVAEMQGIGAAAKILGETSSEAGTNPAVIFTEQWRLRVAATMAVMMNAADSARKQDAPSDAAAVHAQWLDITADLDEAARTIGKGIDDVDAKRLGEGFDIIAGTTPKVETMTPDAMALAEGCSSLDQ